MCIGGKYVTLTTDLWLCQDAYENEMEDTEERVAAAIGEENAHLYPLITKLVIASWQVEKH